MDESSELETIRQPVQPPPEFAGLLVAPKTKMSLTASSSKYPLKWAPQQKEPPTSDQIRSLAQRYVFDKKTSLQTGRRHHEVPCNQEFKLPIIGISRSQKGLNTGPNWFKKEEMIEPTERGATRFSARPAGIDSYNKIFPTRSLKFQKLPKTTSQRFTLINPKVDVDLGNYVVNSNNAFRTHWSKDANLKDRKFFPEEHPEFTRPSQEHFWKRDRVVEYREAMLIVKNMMQSAWVKK